ncbi:Rv0340 family IniB-related protein [[Mycobacterium] burgundiense]|uniref:Rv0340 family protein n=1 Tax=[Mycobacterium] burgundiense TaxID=3064286 RepID=A0ABM9M3D1_9MYCO|nr:Rv0340 family IniB-related protein [Mycolicibacterium sp. MU0053]CAJ1509485.1 Rv0340 family protein [Mycolicibacterium sp. MU0053]
MANELLDFVMSLVRDPAVAARYAADPEGALAAADLTSVTSVDVDNLIPVVADSLSMTTPSFGAATPLDDNVWTSGAATQAFEAFDAFAPAVPEAGIDALADVPNTVIDPNLGAPVRGDDLDLAQQVPTIQQDPQFSGISEPLEDPALDEVAHWDQSVLDSALPADPGSADEPGGFDLF